MGWWRVRGWFKHAREHGKCFPGIVCHLYGSCEGKKIRNLGCGSVLFQQISPIFSVHKPLEVSSVVVLGCKAVVICHCCVEKQLVCPCYCGVWIGIGPRTFVNKFVISLWFHLAFTDMSDLLSEQASRGLILCACERTAHSGLLNHNPKQVCVSPWTPQWLGIDPRTFVKKFVISLWFHLAFTDMSDLLSEQASRGMVLCACERTAHSGLLNHNPKQVYVCPWTPQWLGIGPRTLCTNGTTWNVVPFSVHTNPRTVFFGG